MSYLSVSQYFRHVGPRYLYRFSCNVNKIFDKWITGQGILDWLSGSSKGPLGKTIFLWILQNIRISGYNCNWNDYTNILNIPKNYQFSGNIKNYKYSGYHEKKRLFGSKQLLLRFLRKLLTAVFLHGKSQSRIWT